MKIELSRIIYHKFLEENGFELSTDGNTFDRVAEACIKAVEELKTSKEVEINLPFIAEYANAPKHLILSVTKEYIENYDFNKSTKKKIVTEKKVVGNKLEEKSRNSFLEKLSKEKEEEKKQQKAKNKMIIFGTVAILSFVLTYLVFKYVLG